MENVDKLIVEGGEVSKIGMGNESTDEFLVEKFLGRTPKIGYVIEKRCPSGTPQILRVRPIYQEEGKWKPFPTVFWLVCPRLKMEIFCLEQSGFIRTVLDRFDEDSDFRISFLEGQIFLAKYRMKLVREIFAGDLDAKIEKILSESSIAGSRYPLGVKCLHSHAAQALAFGKNPIGEWVLEKTGRCNSQTVCMSFLKESGPEVKK